MITHRIYHIPGRKVGCTCNLDSRKRGYLSEEGQIPEIEILEELHDKTDEEAGDIEWQWADRMGYSRGTHYAKTIQSLQAPGTFVTMTLEKRKEVGSIGGRKLMSNWTAEQRLEFSRMGNAKVTEMRTLGLVPQLGSTIPLEKRINTGRKSGLLTAALGIGVHGLTKEQRMKNGQKGAAVTTLNKSGGAFQTARCPHCGVEGKRFNMGRNHFNRCPRRKITRPTR